MQTNFPAFEDLRSTTEEVVRIPLRQLRIWDGETRGARVIVLKRDDEAWEGTELDVARTVL